MGFLKRLFGLPVTGMPDDDSSWQVVDGKKVELKLESIPALDKPGGAVRLEGNGLEPRLLVLHGIDDVFRAYKNNCACSGWRIDPVEGEKKVRCCTLAQSTYDYDGKRVSGPAKKDLETLTVEQEGGTLVIRLS